MDPMEFSLEELDALAAERIAAWNKAVLDIEEINDVIAERKRIESLKASLGNISADDIARIQTLLTPASIETSEDVRVA